MRRSIQCTAVQSLTGYGFLYGMRKEFFGTASPDTEHVGPIDAPERIAGGGMKQLEDDDSFSVQITTNRELWPC